MEERMFVWKPLTKTTGTFVGVVVERLNSGSLHVGFLYRAENSPTYILHLEGHNDLQHGPPRVDQVCVLCAIESVRLPAIAAFARRLYKKNRSKGIPYAFSSPAQDWFFEDGNLHLGPERLGLTCGNFVLALYHAVGLPLVSLETWPSREDDVVWQQSFIDELAPRIELAKRETQEHFALVRREIGTVRCRPAEIGGAALASEFPCDFDTAVKLAVDVERALPARPA